MSSHRIAVLSDTHGLLRPEVLAACQGASHILHAGDVGNPSILDDLAAIAPVTAIRGNIDIYGDCALLPEREMVEVHGVLFYLVHSIQDLDIEPTAAGVRAVVFGHSHQPSHRVHRGVLYLNPGSVGPRRFNTPVSMANLFVEDGNLRVEPVTFDR